VLYAPTWTPYSSLNAIGEAVITGLIDAGYTVLVKPHENSFDMAYENSGGIDWAARLDPLLRRENGVLVRDGNASPWLVAADVLVSDHSSIGFEYLLLDRPLIRIEVPELIRRAGIPDEYVALMASASTTVHTAQDVLENVRRALADPGPQTESRRHVAAELFHAPGTATARAVKELYGLIQLDMPDLRQPHQRPSDSAPVQANPGAA
jgi:CDP-glycerol glycerophosphotransferase (TagB/SpsB family)